MSKRHAYRCQVNPWADGKSRSDMKVSSRKKAIKSISLDSVSKLVSVCGIPKYVSTHECVHVGSALRYVGTAGMLENAKININLILFLNDVKSVGSLFNKNWPTWMILPSS